MRWIWEGDKVSFGIGGQTYLLSDCRESEVTEFMSRVARIREIYATLSAARVSFAGGKATYQDSVKNLDNLIDQHEVSGRYCSQVCGGASSRPYFARNVACSCVSSNQSLR